MKQAFGESIGVSIDIVQLPKETQLPELLMKIGEQNKENNNPACTGIVVQLPLPAHIDAEAVCNAITPEKDIDAIGANTSFRAPVALAVLEILQRADISIHGKRIVVVGEGTLVGKPVANMFRAEGVLPQIVTENTQNPEEYYKQADIIVSGAGRPHMITPSMIQNDAVLIDAGTSEQGGVLKGDIDPACADKASVFTPVPGGVGPITIAKLFENLISAAHK